MAVIDALASIYQDPNKALMQQTNYATSAWSNLMEGLKMQRAGEEILDAFKAKGQVTEQDLAGIAEKYHMTLPEFGQAIDLLKKSGAVDLQKQQIQTQKAQQAEIGAQTKRAGYVNTQRGLYNIGQGSVVKGTEPLMKPAKPEAKSVVYIDGKKYSVPKSQVPDLIAKGARTDDMVRNSFNVHLNMLKGYVDPATYEELMNKIGLSPTAGKKALMQIIPQIYERAKKERSKDSALAVTEVDALLNDGELLGYFTPQEVDTLKGEANKKYIWTGDSLSDYGLSNAVEKNIIRPTQ